MQEVNYQITIVDETSEDRTPVSTSNQPEGSDAGEAVSVASATKNKDKGMVAAGLVAVQQVVPYVNQIVNFGVSQIGAETGAVELQQRTQILTGALSAGASIAMSAVIGGVPGAVIATAISALQSTISFVQQSQAIATQKRIEDDNIALRRSRLGQTVNRSRGGAVV